MKLPNAGIASVSHEKIVDYLLSTTHRDGRHKAAFFMSFGFRLDAWEELAKALTEHARINEVAREELSPFGIRYVVEGRIESPDGRRPRLRSIWFVESGQSTPRFVTAYPLKGGDE